MANPPSPENAAVPFPAMVVMIPPKTFRMRLLKVSARYRLPAASTATPPGSLRVALVAGPPSPENPTLPLPATVVMIPPDIFRMRLL